MELATTFDNYTLTVGADGSYEDRIGPFSAHPQGLKCPCNGRHYATRASMVNHIRTDNHQKYKDSLNANRGNHAAELDTARQNIKEYKIIIAQRDMAIAKLEHEKRELIRTIHLLTGITTTRTDAAPDLINFVD